eukprot:XP_011681179.1 PREDICTED: uncharacterized protein LOC105446277 [Strongylocentrotus purpuratus]
MGLHTFGTPRNPGGFKPTATSAQDSVSPALSSVPKGNVNTKGFNSRTPSSKGARAHDSGKPSARGCYMCGSQGHFKNECPLRKQIHSAQGMMTLDGTDFPTQGVEGSDSSQLVANGVEDTGYSIGSLKSVDSSPHANTVHLGLASICLLPVEANGLNSLEQARQSIVNKLGMAYDLVGAMTKHMPVVSGRLEKGNKAVSVLRDCGCTTCVVKSELVDEDQLTGYKQLVLLIDGTVREFSVAKLTVDSPYYVGEIEALCMPHSLFDVVIGDITGAREPRDPDLTWVPKGGRVVSDVADQVNSDDESTIGEVNDAIGVQVVDRDERVEQVANISGVKEDSPLVMAVETRSQKEIKVKPLKGLKIGSPVSCIEPAGFVREQKEDPSLRSLWNKVGRDEKSKYVFVCEGECLYRQRRDGNNPKLGIGHKCVVLPKSQREKVMKVAHESLMGGHIGINNTMAKIKCQFFWPGMSVDVANFCRSCDICQKTASKGRVPKATLGRMPIIGVPFQRIAIDLAGPFTRSERGHTHILTVVDYATRYVEAIPLKTITTVEVAEALLSVYSRVGIPNEVMSDLGPQFVSSLMREVSRLLSIRQVTSSRYHPICNGLVERYNGLIKTALRRLCADEPREWDRYLPALLFALRETPSSSLGYSPFELLYGRNVRGPMDVLRELWTNDDVTPELKDEYEYVIELREKLVKSWELAQETLKGAAGKYKKYYDRNARNRKLDIGDQVLILLPTDQNKLLLKWMGPFPVVGVKYDYDYIVDVKGVPKTYHINLLKKYFPREEVDLSVAGCFDMCTESSEVCEDSGEDVEVQISDLDRAEVTVMPSIHQKEFIEHVRVNESLEESRRKEISQLLREYQDIFSDVPKKTTAAECKLHLTSDEPVRSPPYKVPQAMKETVEKEVDTMLRMGIIEPADSPYDQ